MVRDVAFEFVAATPDQVVANVCRRRVCARLFRSLARALHGAQSDPDLGLARGVGAIDLRVIGGIIVSWLVTLPVGGVLAALFFFTLKGMFT